MRKPTKSEYVGIEQGLLCAYCLKPLRYNNHYSSLCIDCWLQFQAEGNFGYQCEALQHFDLCD